jgi:predicted O-methyltransferase YrrM
MLFAWQQLVDTDAAYESGQDVYQHIFADHILFPLQRRRECEKMTARVREIFAEQDREPKVFVEIGSDKGGSVYHWLKAFPSVNRAVALEMRGVPWQNWASATFPAVDIRGVYGSSFDAMNVHRVQNICLEQEPIDILFIDGHKGEFRRDFDCYLPLMRPGGVIVMHDILVQAPGRAFRSMQRDGFKTEEIIDTTERLADVPAAWDCGSGSKANLAGYAWWLSHWETTSCGVGLIHVPSDDIADDSTELESEVEVSEEREIGREIELVGT